MEPSLVVRHLSKNFQKVGPPAVRDLNFRINPGEAVAFLGPNGAGKSTTIKLLCGILTPTSGEALVMNLPAGSLKANSYLGLVFGTRSQMSLHMTVKQCLNLMAEIYFLTGKAKIRRIEELSDIFHISPLLTRRVRTLSLGERMRCELVAALIHRPRILLADEPTIGLDIIAKNQLRDLIRRWQQEENTTLMLTSHDLSDVEALCQRCILIDKGIKRFDGPLIDLKGDLSSIRRIQITTSEGSLAPLTDDLRLKVIARADFSHHYELSTEYLPISDALARLSRHYGDGLQDVSISEISLEEVLGKMYQQESSWD